MSPECTGPRIVSSNVFVIALVDEVELEVTVADGVEDDEEVVICSVSAGVDGLLPQEVAHPTVRRRERTRRP